jgi:hypothetical protein
VQSGYWPLYFSPTASASFWPLFKASSTLVLPAITAEMSWETLVPRSGSSGMSTNVIPIVGRGWTPGLTGSAFFNRLQGRLAEGVDYRGQRCHHLTTTVRHTFVWFPTLNPPSGPRLRRPVPGDS